MALLGLAATLVRPASLLCLCCTASAGCLQLLSLAVALHLFRLLLFSALLFSTALPCSLSAWFSRLPLHTVLAAICLQCWLPSSHLSCRSHWLLGRNQSAAAVLVAVLPWALLYMACKASLHAPLLAVFPCAPLVAARAAVAAAAVSVGRCCCSAWLLCSPLSFTVPAANHQQQTLLLLFTRPSGGDAVCTLFVFSCPLRLLSAPAASAFPLLVSAGLLGFHC